MSCTVYKVFVTPLFNAQSWKYSLLWVHQCNKPELTNSPSVVFGFLTIWLLQQYLVEWALRICISETFQRMQMFLSLELYLLSQATLSTGAAEPSILAI